MFCVDGFGAVACGVWVVVGFWMRWLAVGDGLWGRSRWAVKGFVEEGCSSV